MRAVCAIVFCLPWFPPAAQPRSGPDTSRPDVFLITIDTLRADHVHCYGYSRIQTPALDGLANDGVRFSQAFTPSPITNTSHTSILTGLLPGSHGVTDFAIPLDASHPTWAELLKARGYHTAAFIGAVILDSHKLAPGLDRGFDFYDNFPSHSPANMHWGRLERRAMDVTARAEKWLAAHPAGPHFIWIHLYDPHDPYQPPPPYSETYKDTPYDGEIAYADAALGNFFAYLRTRGWYDHAVLIVVGDHGEGLGQHGEDTHGIFLYDSTTHVPMILKFPGKAAAQIIASQVRTIDLLPTTLDLLGLKTAATFDGESLQPLLSGAGAADRVAFGETDYPVRFGWAPLRSVRDNQFKFIESPRPELYDLRADPGEVHNQYVPWDRAVGTSRALLLSLRSRLPPHAPSAASVPQSTVEELKALGYFGSSDVGSSTNVPEPSLLPDPKDKIEEANLLHRAMMAAEDDRLSDAETAFERVLALSPGSATALRQIGDVEMRAGEYAKAAVHLRAAREARPGDAAVAFSEGEAREKLKDYEGARSALQASLKSEPNQLSARLLLGTVYLALKDPSASKDQFEAASLLDSGSVEAQLGIARAEMLNADYERARAELSELSRANPGNADVFELLAQVDTMLGKPREAREAQRRAEQLRAQQHHRQP